MRRSWLLTVALLLAPALPAGAQAPPAPPAMPGKFELLGHNPLNMRGMNAALAVHGGYAYVGNRTDGTHPFPGVFVVDVRDPSNPTIVNEMGPPDEGLPTQSSRELRILPDQKLLLVLNHQCSEAIHRCAGAGSAGVTALPSNIKFFDIAGENAADPELVATYEPSASAPQTPHEFFIWNDPKRPSRVLMYMSTPSGSDFDVTVTDLSRAREGIFPEIAGFTAEGSGGYTHSMTVSNDGRRLYLAQLTGGFQLADTSELADGKADAKIKLITPSENAPTWDGPGAHSAISLPGRPDQVLISDEVYGMVPGLLSTHGCPWGWVRFIDSSNPVTPVVQSEYRLPVNQADYCASVGPDRNTLSSHAAHNPTLTENLAIITWHSQGLHAIDTSNPAAPSGAAFYMPEPLPAVMTEDPLLSSGPDKVVMWSFPVIVDGLIYVVDLRNGLYILRYRGPHENEVARAKFLDGNSNSGDVQRMEPVPGTAGTRPDARPGPAAGGPAPCLATPLRAGGRRVGPFSLGLTRQQAEIRGGPPRSVRRSALVYCAEGGGKVGVAFRRSRVALIASSSPATTGLGRFTPGRRGRTPRNAKRLGGGLLLVRAGRSVSIFARVRGGRVRVAGVVAGRPKARELKRLLRASGV